MLSEKANTHTKNNNVFSFVSTGGVLRNHWPSPTASFHTYGNGCHRIGKFEANTSLNRSPCLFSASMTRGPSPFCSQSHPSEGHMMLSLPAWPFSGAPLQLLGFFLGPGCRCSSGPAALRDCSPARSLGFLAWVSLHGNGTSSGPSSLMQALLSLLCITMTRWVPWLHHHLYHLADSSVFLLYALCLLTRGWTAGRLGCASLSIVYNTVAHSWCIRNIC